MRAAKVGDYRRTLREKPARWSARIERIAFAGVPGLGTGEISLSSPVTFLSGPNGVGKTTLLRGCWAALAPAAAQGSPGTLRRFSSGSFTVALRSDGANHECQATAASGALVGTSSHPLEIVHVDSAEIVTRLHSFFEDYPELENYTEGAGAHALTDGELAEIGFLTRRTYRSASMYEVEGMGEIFPFFEIAYADQRYDSRTMGTGELAALFLWWTLRRAEPKSILLIEEPETFLSPASQEALSAHLVSVACEKKLCVVATSHSAPLISPMADDSLRFIVRDGGDIALQTDAPEIVFKNLGIEPAIEAVLLTEDELGCAFAKALIRRFEPRLARRIDLSIRNGDGNVFATLRQMPDTERIRFFGLLDGDVRASTPEDVAPRCLYLPGEIAIERIFRALIEENPTLIGEVTGSDRIGGILASLDGQDHHDWFGEFAAQLSYTKLQLFPLMFTVWLRNEAFVEAGRDTVAAIQRALDQRPT